MSWGTVLALPERVQVLEARFYPRTKTVPTFVVVANVICDRRRATITGEVAHSAEVKPFDLGGLLTKLRFLVDAAVPEPGPELLSLRSQFWSFVEVPTEPVTANPG